MDEELTARVIRADDFVAELVEEEAARMPPSYQERADVLRQFAIRLRASGETKLVRVWEPTDKPVSHLVLLDGTAVPIKLENFGLNLTNDVLDLTLLVALNSKSSIDAKALRNVQAVQLSKEDGQVARMERIAFNNAIVE